MPRLWKPAQYGCVKSSSLAVTAIPFSAAPVFPADAAEMIAGGVSAEAVMAAMIAAHATRQNSLQFNLMGNLQFFEWKTRESHRHAISHRLLLLHDGTILSALGCVKRTT